MLSRVFQVDKHAQRRSISRAFEATAAASDVMLLEGTGHVGVGSCINASNAQVASMLNADMVLVANGGIGSTFDELDLNYQACRAANVRLAGVVVNKVMPEKCDEVRRYMTQLLERNWGVPLLGVVPDRPFLGFPALKDLERLLGTDLISGGEFRLRHFDVAQISLVTTVLGHFLGSMKNKQRACGRSNDRTLYVTHVTRNDIILAFLSEHQRKLSLGLPSESALILCGNGEARLCPEIEAMARAGNAPILHVRESTWPVMTKIAAFAPKLNIDDTHRVTEAVDWYEPHIDVDQLVARAST